MNGNCNLCGREGELIKSHIIPQSLYKPILDGDNPVRVVEKDKVLVESRLRTGIYDVNILCAVCDQLINKYYDDYGARIWKLYNDKTSEVIDYVDRNVNIEWRQAKNVDAERFKTFLLSILWRAHVSVHEFFDDVDLGEKHSSAIRSLILDRTPAIDYEIILAHYAIRDTTPQGFISTIHRYRSNEGKHYYSAMIAGIQIHWFISKNGVSDGLKSFVVNSKNGLKILKSPLQGFNAIRHFIGDEILRMPKVKAKRK